MNTAKITKLRQIMNKHAVDYYFVPSTDPHRNEYVPEHWQRRAFISDFTGSAGDVLIGKKSAYLWVDPRYELQAQAEVDSTTFELIYMASRNAPTISEWLLQQPNGLVVAVDPQVISHALAQEWSMLLAAKQGKLLLVEENWIDQIWEDQPILPPAPMRIYSEQYAGQSFSQKLQALREALQSREADTLVIHSLEAICWLLNLRGNDIPYNPFMIAYAIITQNAVTLFVDPCKMTEEVRAYVHAQAIHVQPYTAFVSALQKESGVVLVDPAQTSEWIYQQLPSCIFGVSPIDQMKAIKNATELQGMREAHVLDGVAVARFLHWLEESWQTGVTELSAEQKLNELRRENSLCVDLSFNTISGFGPHGAIIHYSATEKTNIPIDDSNLYLVDSGGQYFQGTTDITRTTHLGQPSAMQRDHYTLVLQGHLAIVRLIFPKGTCGEDINAFAHAPLWQAGLDYAHGTGHGVGCYASVHQFPPTISARKTNCPFLPGMVLSNEPGLYLENQYGIRIENLMEVVAVERDCLTRHGPFYGFKNLTFVPYERKLIAVEKLSAVEVAEINRYHEEVYHRLSPHIQEQAVLDWLARKTAPL